MMQEQDLMQKIIENAKLTQEELNKLIEEKEHEFSGLVSRQGAILIVAKELGLDLIQHMNKNLKIANITSGLQRVNIFGKIVYISPIKEFENKQRSGTGKVATVILGDETGTIRLSLWNEQTTVIDKIKVGDVLEVINGFTKTDYKGQPEIRFAKYGNLRKVDDMQIEVKQADFQKGSHTTTTINDINAPDAKNKYVHLKGQLVQIYDRKLIHYLCPECKKKVMGAKCETHGEIVPNKFLVLSGVLDDGTGTISTSFFNDSVEAMIGKTVEEIEKTIMYSGEKSFFSSIDVLGAFLNVKGTVKENQVMNTKDLAVQQVKLIDAVSEINTFLHDFPEKNKAELSE